MTNGAKEARHGHNLEESRMNCLCIKRHLLCTSVIQKNMKKYLRAQGGELYQIQTAARGEYQWIPNSTCWQADEQHQHVTRYKWKASSPDVRALLYPILELPNFVVCTRTRKNEYIAVHIYQSVFHFLPFGFYFILFYLSSMSDIGAWHSSK